MTAPRAAADGVSETLSAVAHERDELLAEVLRLQGVDFIHQGCAGLRERDNAHLIAERDAALAEVVRLRAQVAELRGTVVTVAFEAAKPNVHVHNWPYTRPDSRGRCQWAPVYSGVVLVCEAPDVPGEGWCWYHLDPAHRAGAGAVTAETTQIDRPCPACGVEAVWYGTRLSGSGDGTSYVISGCECPPERAATGLSATESHETAPEAGPDGPRTSDALMTAFPLVWVRRLILTMGAAV